MPYVLLEHSRKCPQPYNTPDRKCYKKERKIKKLFCQIFDKSAFRTCLNHHLLKLDSRKEYLNITLGLPN